MFLPVRKNVARQAANDRTDDVEISNGSQLTVAPYSDMLFSFATFDGTPNTIAILCDVIVTF